jgi:hypothetical protein
VTEQVGAQFCSIPLPSVTRCCQTCSDRTAVSGWDKDRSPDAGPLAPTQPSRERRQTRPFEACPWRQSPYEAFPGRSLSVPRPSCRRHHQAALPFVRTQPAADSCSTGTQLDQPERDLTLARCELGGKIRTSPGTEPSPQWSNLHRQDLRARPSPRRRSRGNHVVRQLGSRLQPSADQHAGTDQHPRRRSAG